MGACRATCRGGLYYQAIILFDNGLETKRNLAFLVQKKKKKRE